MGKKALYRARTKCLEYISKRIYSEITVKPKICPPRYLYSDFSQLQYPGL